MACDRSPFTERQRDAQVDLYVVWILNRHIGSHRFTNLGVMSRSPRSVFTFFNARCAFLAAANRLRSFGFSLKLTPASFAERRFIEVPILPLPTPTSFPVICTPQHHGD
jgi:hypothetical protein